MKKLLALSFLGVVLCGASGCHVGECWRYAWNSRFHPERNAQLCAPQQTCVVSDSCCCDPCDGATVVTTPASPGCNCGGGAPVVTPGPIVAH